MGISLTAGMRSNLINLQNTAKLMDQTAVRLNTGKKVNSALDDPISYFTARNHMIRADDLGTLKNGMSEGIQTIQAANNGIEAIISLIEDAKSKAESAKSAAESGDGFTTSAVTLDGVVATDTITIGGTEFTASTASGGTDFKVTVGDDALTALSLANAVMSNTSNAIDVTSINGSTVSFENSAANMDAESIEFTATTPPFSETLVSGSTERDELEDQYNTLMEQINFMQADSGYKGINLLSGDDKLSVKFEGDNEIELDGFDGDVAGLSLFETAGGGAGWGANNIVDDDIDKLDDAIDMLESKASLLASSLSIVTTRQDFTENMINTLTTGADNLTLADINEEGANMLMLQTQQALGTTSLGMAAETAQSVLRLF